MSTCKLVLGTLSGLAIGAIAGILFAPAKGSTTRQQIMDKRDDYVDQLKSKVGEFSDSLTEEFIRTVQGADELIDQGIEEYDDLKHDVKITAADLKHDISADINNFRR